MVWLTPILTKYYILKYNDTIAQAQQKMTQVTLQLQQWCIPANPINYAIAYHYFQANNLNLIEEINLHLKVQGKLDDFFLVEVYRQYILGQSDFKDNFIHGLDQVLTDLNQQSMSSLDAVDSFLKNLHGNVNGLRSNNRREMTKAIEKIYQASQVLKIQQAQVASKIKASNEEMATLKLDLDAMRKEVFIDPLTGLYNRKALNQHVATWLAQDPEQEIAAIAIHIDHFVKITDKFGVLISNVLLAKVANKVNSYVGESGLPVRTGSDEFLILLPQVEHDMALEIAEKIRQGVEKLRFVSSTTGLRLPKITISLSVNETKANHNFQMLLAKVRILIKNFQRKDSNQVLLTSS